jgi:hypothetical protein
VQLCTLDLSQNLHFFLWSLFKLLYMVRNGAFLYKQFSRVNIFDLDIILFRSTQIITDVNFQRNKE